MRARSRRMSNAIMFAVRVRKDPILRGRLHAIEGGNAWARIEESIDGASEKLLH